MGSLPYTPFHFYSRVAPKFYETRFFNENTVFPLSKFLRYILGFRQKRHEIDIIRQKIEYLKIFLLAPPAENECILAQFAICTVLIIEIGNIYT